MTFLRKHRTTFLNLIFVSTLKKTKLLTLYTYYFDFICEIELYSINQTTFSHINIIQKFSYYWTIQGFHSKINMHAIICNFLSGSISRRPAFLSVLFIQSFMDIFSKLCEMFFLAFRKHFLKFS